MLHTWPPTLYIGKYIYFYLFILFIFSILYKLSQLIVLKRTARTFWTLSWFSQHPDNQIKSDVLFEAKYFLLDSLEASFLALNVFPVQNTFTLHLDLLFLYLMLFPAFRLDVSIHQNYVLDEFIIWPLTCTRWGPNINHILVEFIFARKRPLRLALTDMSSDQSQFALFLRSLKWRCTLSAKLFFLWVRSKIGENMYYFLCFPCVSRHSKQAVTCLCVASRVWNSFVKFVDVDSNQTSCFSMRDYSLEYPNKPRFRFVLTCRQKKTGSEVRSRRSGLVVCSAACDR